MSIHFSKQNWNNIRSVYNAWWKRELERPVINLTFTAAPSDIEKPKDYIAQQMWQYPEDTPVEQILQNDLYTLSTQRFTADAYPMVLPDYGAGVNAAFCGCKPIRGNGTVWFHPPAPDINPQDLHLTHHPESKLYNLIREYYEKAREIFEDNVVLGMTHLNNGIDTVARFFDAEPMLLALHDYPEEIKRLVSENHRLFLNYLKEFSNCMGKVPGYSCWGGIYGEKPWFGVQSDFCYMIGPDDFQEFILPELEQCWQLNSEANFYHLDGPGQLIHLDAILDSPNLRCVQWVPGAGAAAPIEWPEIYKKITEKGKNIWYMGELKELEQIANICGTSRGLYWQGHIPWVKRDESLSLLKRLNVPTNIGG